ncbi:MAG: hypothetical protein LBF38_04035 [Deltaproteobacteria bacterium]|jgi:hypothetical protein|nr:hypothetical protein [Deltaproteobacteria bacterium]
MKKILLLTAFLMFFGQGLALGLPKIDPEKYVTDDYNVNSQVPKDSEDDEFEFDGFMSPDNEEGNLRLDDFKLPNAYDLKLKNVSAKVLSLTIKPKRCDLTANVSLAYPVNLGNLAADKFVKTMYDDMFDDAIKEALEWLDEKMRDQETCPQSISNTVIYQSSFKIIETNPNIISLITYVNVSTGYFHPINHTRAKIIDIKTAGEVYLSDLFPQKQASLKKLWPYLANAYCKMDQGGSTLPVFYGQTECPKNGFGPSAALPEAWTDPGVDFQALGGNVYLSPKGLHVGLGAYQSWSYASGPTEVLVPKDEAIKMGASKAYW